MEVNGKNAIIIHTNGLVRTVPAGENFSEFLAEKVSGFIEIVRPVGLEDPYVMIINEDGFTLGLDFNVIASILYGARDHGMPILGTAVVVKEDIGPDGPDLFALTEAEAGRAMGLIQKSMMGS